MKPYVRPWCNASCRSRRWETALARLRIGHTRLTHGYLMSGGTRGPLCTVCNVPLTVKHIMVQCTQYDVQRRKYFPNLQRRETLFDMISESEHFNVNSLMAFLDESNLLSLL